MKRLHTFLIFLALSSAVLVSTNAYAEEPATVTAAAPSTSNASPEQFWQKFAETKTELVQKNTRAKIDVGQPPEKEASMSGKVSNVLMILGLAAFVAISVYPKLKKKKSLTTGDGIVVVSRTPIGPRSSLIVVEAEGKRLLLSQAGDDVNFLTLLNDGYELPADYSLPQSDFQPRAHVG